MIWLWLLLELIASSAGGRTVSGPTYAAAEWPCSLDWDCYVVVSWADGPGEPLLVGSELGG